jgi:glycosyltransferase 2 family protein
MNPQNNNQPNYAKISNYKVILRFILTWLTTIAIFVIIFSRIKFVDVFALIKQTDITLLCAGMLFSVFAHLLLSSIRYQKVVEAMGCRLSFFEAVIIRMGCNPIKGILPFRMGELAIAAYMKKKYNLSYTKGFVSISFGYIFSFIVLIIFYSFGCILYLQSLSHRIIFSLPFLLILSLVTPLGFRYIQRLLAWFYKKFRKLPEASESLIEQYDSKTIKVILLHSFGIEGFKLLIIFILLKSFNINIPVNALLLFGSATIIAAYIPITYWGLGIRESAILFLFAGYATPDKLLAGSLLITFVDSIFPVLLGLFFVKPFLNSLWGSEKEGMN